MNHEQLAEMAHLYATEGLEGERLAEFEAWRETSSPREKSEFASIVDGIAMLSLSRIPEAPPSADVKDRLMKTIAAPEAPSAVPAPAALAGFEYSFKDEGEWVDLPAPGSRVKALSDRKEDGVTAFLLEMDAHAVLPGHRHHGVEMAYVLEGDLQTEGRSLRAGDFLRAGAGSEHAKLYSEGGCRALLITATENFPRRTVGVMRRLQDVFRAARDLVGAGKEPPEQR